VSVAWPSGRATGQATSILTYVAPPWR